jgi:quinol monooxygenase YgiN
MNTDVKEIVVIATAVAAPGHEADLANALKKVAAPTRAQRGCLEFKLYRSDDGATVTAVEHWASKGDHEAHLQGKHVQELIGNFKGILAKPPIIMEMKPFQERPS